MKPKNKTLSDDIKEMMEAWKTIENKAKRTFPKASPEEIYKITKSAMNQAIGLTK